MWTHKHVLSWGQYRELSPERVLMDHQLLDDNPQKEVSFNRFKVRGYLKLLEKAGNVPTRKRGERVVKAVKRYFVNLGL